jgi:hypothetical protein
MFNANASAAEKKQNEETQAADAMKKKTDKDKAPKRTHKDYRLWITTEGHPNFPISLLQILLKLTHEPPAGAEASMKRTLLAMSQQTIDTIEYQKWRGII